MTGPKLGDWRWYSGAVDDDDEMCEGGTRDQAIKDGRVQMQGDRFYIIEARMQIRDENAMGAGRIDCAPFAETRNGEWIYP